MSEAKEPTKHAFISYVRDDSRDVDRMQAALEAAGIRVWRDTADLWPGEDWRKTIRHEITGNALAFIACFSSRSLARESTYQREELILAIEELRSRSPDIPWLIPVRFDDCRIPHHSIGAGRTLDSLQRVDLFGERVEQETSRLVTAVARILAPGPAFDRHVTEGGSPGQTSAAADAAAPPGTRDTERTHGGTPQRRWPWPVRRTILVACGATALLSGLLLLVVNGVLAGGRPAANPGPGRTASPSASGSQGAAAASSSSTLPFAYSVQVDEDACSGGQGFHVIPLALSQKVGSPYHPDQATFNGAPDAGYTDVVVNLQGKTTTATTLEAMKVYVSSRAKPSGAAYENGEFGCGGLQPAFFYVNLDSPDPHPVAAPGHAEPNTVIPAVPLPITVSSADPAQFRIEGITRACDCRWYAMLEWTQLGKSGWVKITNAGQTFRTVGIDSLPIYCAGCGPGWTRLSDQQWSALLPKP